MSKNKIKIPKLFPTRKKNTHKGDYGKIFILAGAPGMLGAAVLCSRGALRSGAGLIYLGVSAKDSRVVNVATPEVIAPGIDSFRDFTLLNLQPKAIAMGPGLGNRRSLCPEFFHNFNLQKYSGTVIIDADGLNAFVGNLALLEKHNLNLILTPHPGELARLLGISTEAIQINRSKVAQEVARRFNCILVLKGEHTVIAGQKGGLVVNRTGNPGMATAGTGDVLTGIIAGLVAQGNSAWDSAVVSVYLHGLAGDLATKDKGEYGMIASDLVENIPYAIQKIC